MMRIVMGACAYLALAFGAGFILGVVRTLWLAPAIGETQAVLIELPLMAVICWFVCRAAMRWTRPPAGVLPRILLGGLWFAGLQGLEALLAGMVRDLSVTQWAQMVTTPAGLASLTVMLACATFPLLQARRKA